MKLREIARDIFNISFPTQEELSRTFIRFQEHFESPEFRGRIFTLEEFKKWYIQNSEKGRETGEFTYYSDWNGFNIPSSILEPFYNGDFDPLSEREIALLNLFKGKKEKYYIIGTHIESKHGKDSLKHEIAHGLFFTNSDYRREVLEALQEIETGIKNPIYEFFRNSGGYHPDVWEDELHAYILFGLDKLENKYQVNVSSLREFEKMFKEIFQRYFSEN